MPNTLSPNELDELARRCEAATGPDRELDKLAHQARGYRLREAHADERYSADEAERIARVVKSLAQVDTHPQGGDAKQAPGESLSSAVGSEADDAPNPSNPSNPSKDQHHDG